MTSSNCIFCKIAAGQAPANVIYQDDLITAFHDIHPITPVHILIIPNVHIDSLNEFEPQHEPAVGRIFSVARQLAVNMGLNQRGYRLVTNTGPEAGQSVFHLHFHLIGGRRMPFKFNEE